MTTYEQILALQTKANELVARRNYYPATQTQLKALKLAQDLKRPKLTAVLYQRLGQILEQDGELQKMLYAYESAFKALHEEEHHLDKTIAQLRRVSKSYHEDAKIEIPDVYSPTVASSIEEALKDEYLHLKLLLQIGNSYFYQPQIEPALNAYQQVLAQNNINNQPLLKAQTLVNVGEIFRQKKILEEAQKKITEAMQLFEKHGREVDKKHAYTLQARLHFKHQKIDKAIPLYEKALAIFEAEKDIKNAGKVYTQLGQLYLNQHDFNLAKSHYTKALACANKTSHRDLEWHVHWGLGCCFYEEKNWLEAAKHIDKSRSKILRRQNSIYTDEGKVAFLESVQDVFHRLIEVYLKIGDEPSIKKALEVAEDAKGQSLSDLMQGRSRQRASQKIKVDDDYPSLDNPMQQMSPGVMTPPPDSTDSIRQEAISVDSFANMPPPMPIISNTKDNKKIAPRKPSARCFLFFYKLKNQLLIWLKKADEKIILHQCKVDSDEISTKVTQFRNALIQDAHSRGIDISRGVKTLTKANQFRDISSFDSGSVKDTFADYKTISKEIYQLLLAPFKDELDNKTKALVIVPHDFIWVLPFAALIDEENHFLNIKHTLFYTPSIKALEQIDRENPYSTIADLKALIIGNPSMTTQHEQYRFKSLQGAEKEAITLSELFKTKALINEAANYDAVEKQAKEVNLLHLATHGITDEEKPLDSFLVLADSADKIGILKARAIMEWALPCELVNLSACQTALGKKSGEGIIGLSRAFLVAGSRSVLVSQWNISDEATAQFMIRFYIHYLALNNKAIALQNAMNDMLAHPQYQHPVFWSAFTLVGSDD